MGVLARVPVLVCTIIAAAVVFTAPSVAHDRAILGKASAPVAILGKATPSPSILGKA